MLSFACFLVYTRSSGVLLARKNIFGIKPEGERKTRPRIWRGCGQVVIPGGPVQPQDCDLVANARRSFRQSTGIDFSNEAVRVEMGCVGREREFLFPPEGPEFGCLYQEVTDCSPILQRATGNILALNVDQDELHDVFLASAAEASGLFGTPEMPLESWRKKQYYSLSKRLKKAARESMNTSHDWFGLAIRHLQEQIGP